MRFLFVHQGFPGQFLNIVEALIRRKDEIVVICRNNKDIKGLKILEYQLDCGNGGGTFRLAKEYESKVIRGYAVSEVAQRLKYGEYGKPFSPDLIVGHPGWGEMIFLKAVWPDVPQLHYVEYFYGVPGTDNDIDDMYAAEYTVEQGSRCVVKNACLLESLSTMKGGITPTMFQESILPIWARNKTEIIHDGIDTEYFKPDKDASLTLKHASGMSSVIRHGDPVITFINRTFEPYRGVHIFIKALIKILEVNKNVRVLMVGKDTPNVSYGAKREDGIGWLQALMIEYGEKLDTSRIYNVGVVDRNTLRQIYQVSMIHVYLTYPFVLSWSLLEAMSCGGMVVGSDTAPVREVIKDKWNGLLVPFSDDSILARKILDTINNNSEYHYLRDNARRTVIEHYEKKNCVDRALKYIDRIARKE